MTRQTRTQEELRTKTFFQVIAKDEYELEKLASSRIAQCP